MSYDKTIKLDTDGVIRNLMSAIYIVLKDKFPEKTPSEEPVIDQWRIHKSYPKFEKRNFYSLIFGKYVEEIFLETAKPYKGALDFVKKLNKLNNTRVIIRTHQDYNRALYTLKWLMKYDIQRDGFFVSRSKTDNKDLINNNSILIDDKAKNVENGGGNAILINRKWNNDFDLTEYDNKFRAMDYDDVFNKIYKIWD